MSKLKDDLQSLKDPTHIYKNLQEAVGKEILCEDGVVRLVTKIQHSAGNFKFALVNENDQDGGYLVHLYKLFAQLRNEPEPPADLLAQFDKICDSFFYEYKKPEAPKPKKKKITDVKFQVH